MTMLYLRLGLSALALAVAVPAYAGASADFSGCDGLKKPKSSDDGMRGEATIPVWRSNNLDSPKKVIAACDAAFERKLLRPEQTLRKAHMLRARSAAKLQLGRTVEALEDLEAAEAAAQQYEGDFFYGRSMGVSLDLLRAIILHEQGQGGEAARLAEAAATERPYSLQVQRVATLLRDLNRGDLGDLASIWAALQAIDPSSRRVFPNSVARPADFSNLLADAGEPDLALPPPPGIDEIIKSGGDATAIVATWDRPVRNAMMIAYAEAAKGDIEAAQARVEQARTEVDRARTGATSKSTLGKILADMVSKDVLEPMAQLIDARIAIAESRPAEAAKLLEGRKLIEGPVTNELYAAYGAATEASVDPLPELAPLGSPMAVRTPQLTRLADEILMRPESERKLIDYKKSRPNILGALVGGALTFGTSLLGGIDRTAGFRSTDNGDGTLKVEYTGNTTSGAVVQEMTLLRAAELAKEGGKSHFLVTARRDYQRYLTMMQYGMATERTLTGYKTELTVRFLDEPEDGSSALDAVAVIDALGPIYYED